MDASQMCFHGATTGIPEFPSISFSCFFFCLFVCLFFLFRAAPMAYGSSWLGEVESELQLPTYAAQQLRIRATSAVYNTAHNNAGTLTR